MTDPRLALRYADRGAPGGIATLGPDGIVPPEQLPPGLSAPVLSVNGHTGAVVLGYADVGAVSATDPRLGDQRTPLDASVTNAKVAAGAAIAYSKLNLAGAVVDADIASAAAIAESKLALASDAAAGVASRRTLGTGALQAAAGSDARFTDSRAPSGAAGGVLSGTYPNPGLASSVVLPGTPTVGTPPGSTDVSAAVATTSFVHTAVVGLAPLASPSFTGTPTVGANAIPVTIGGTTRKMNMGSGSVTFTASGTSAVATVTHGLGVTPAALGAFTNGGFVNVSFTTQNANSTTFEVVGQLTNGTTASITVPFSWFAST